tara:strand:- start:1507 stop:2664 length:1158 start_codon:yes stop_codon:yes gene_type:complete
MSYKITNNIVLGLILILGIYLSFTGGYGSDEDTLPMIGTFFGFQGGKFMTSRFTGYPVAEFIIGFFSYYFGSFLINLIIFLSLIAGSIIFYISLVKKIIWNDLALFLILLLSNPILFFENLEPMDYSLAFLFFSLGYFFLNKDKIELSIVFFGICIGTRLNFAPLVIALIYFSKQEILKQDFRRYSLILTSLFIGCLFYVPVWIHSGLELDWLRAGRPEGNFFEYFTRFSYKLITTFGIIQFIIIIFLFKNNFRKIINYKFIKLLFFLILINLIIFLYIPAERSYLQPMIIFLYFILFIVLSKKYIYLLVSLNLITWFVNFDFINVKYKYDNICDPVQAVSAKIDLKYKEGYLYEFKKSRELIKCWIDVDSEYGKKVLSGAALKK